MYGSFEGWLQTNGYPWETYEDAKARYRSLYGEDEDFPVAEAPSYTFEPQEPEEEERGFLDILSEGSDWVPSMSEFGSAAAKSWYDTKASGATFGETIAAPALDWLGFDETAEDIREGAPAYREEQLAEAAKYPEVQNRLQKRLAEDPNYNPAETRVETLARLKAEGSEWYDIAKHVPEWIPLTIDKAIEDAPTAGEVGSFATGSALPMAGAAAVGLPLLAAGAPAWVAGGAAMTTGGFLSSSLVSTETADQIKNNPVIRRALNMDDKTPFERLPSTDQHKIGKVAEDGAQNNLGQRIISSGIPEMLAYIPAGGWLMRAIADIAGGTTSEVWDISVSREAMIDALIENGVDPRKTAELDAALQAIGPKKSEVFMKAIVGETVATGPIVVAEQIVMSKIPKKDHRVDVGATITAEAEKQRIETEEDERKGRLDRYKSLLDKKATSHGLVEGIVELWNVDPDRATQELEDLKKFDRKVQNDVVDILSAEHPEVVEDVTRRIGDADRQQEYIDKLKKADEERKKAQDELDKLQKAEEKELAKENEVVEAKKVVENYQSERADMIAAKAAGTITQEEFDAWDQKNRPIDAIKTAKKYDDSVKAEAEAEAKAKAKKEEEAEAETEAEVEVETEKTTTKKKKTTTKKKTPPKTIEEEVVELLQSVDEGGAPSVMTPNLKKIAKAVGVEVTSKDKPIDVIDKIRAKARGEAETVVEETPTEKEMITVYYPDGTPVKVEVTARSKAGSVRIIDPDTGQDILVTDSTKYGLVDPNSPDFVLETEGDTPTVSSLSDARLKKLIEKFKKLHKTHKAGEKKEGPKKGYSPIAMERIVNALKMEQKRRATAKLKAAEAEAKRKKGVKTEVKAKPAPTTVAEDATTPDLAKELNNYLQNRSNTFKNEVIYS